MNNILLISLYKPQNIHMCSSITNLVVSSSLPIQLLNIFQETGLFQTTKICASYSGLFRSDKVEFIAENKDTKSWFQNRYLNKYNYFVFLPDNIVFHNGLLQNLLSMKLSDDTVYEIIPADNLTRIFVLNKPSMIESLQKISNFSDITNINQSKTQKIQSKDFFILSNIERHHNNILTPQESLYIDKELFTLVYFMEEDTTILSSYCYINKRNNKIYNINNDFIGIVTEKTESIIRINWSTTQENHDHVYNLDIKNDNFLYYKNILVK